jgi:hypothetical protein
MLVSTRRALMSAAFVLTTLAACAHTGSGQVQGRLASGGGYLGDWDFYPASCEAQTYGVILTEDGSDKRKVLLLDRNGGTGTRRQRLDVHVDGDTPNGNMDVMLSDPRCVTTSLKRIGNGFDGKLEVDCETGEGGRVRGTISFANCPLAAGTVAKR